MHNSHVKFIQNAFHCYILYSKVINIRDWKTTFLKSWNRTENCEFSVILWFNVYKILEFDRNIRHIFDWNIRNIFDRNIRHIG